MSVQKDGSGRRSIQVESEVPGTPEEVWQAIATGPGISSWFVPTRSDERVGGEVVSTFGPGMDCPATITVWEPPMRFAAESPMGPPGAPTMATEWIVEARSGGKCMVRVVHSLFTSSEDWDGQLDGMEQGWPAYFRILQRFLADFKGQTCSAAQFIGFSTESEEKTWEMVGGPLGIRGLAVGQRWSAPEGFPPTGGVVDTLGKGSHANTMLLRLDTPAPGTGYVGAFTCGGMVQVYLAFFFYAADARSAIDRDSPAWQAWVSERFPMPAMG